MNEEFSLGWFKRINELEMFRRFTKSHSSNRYEI